jgi:hypothetical protein
METIAARLRHKTNEALTTSQRLDLNPTMNREVQPAQFRLTRSDCASHGLWRWPRYAENI